MLKIENGECGEGEAVLSFLDWIWWRATRGRSCSATKTISAPRPPAPSSSFIFFLFLMLKGRSVEERGVHELKNERKLGLSNPFFQLNYKNTLTTYNTISNSGP